MFIDATVDEMLGKLEEPKFSYYDYFMGVSLHEALNHEKEDFRFWVNLANSPLKNLYSYMQRNNLTYLFEPVAEMVANAGRHGNRDSICNAPNGDPMKSLSIKIFSGENGILFRVRNEGVGFDYKEINLNPQLMRSQNILGGNGIRMLANPRFYVSYEDCGRATNLLFLLNS